MASKDDEFLTMKLLRTPAGQQVLQAFMNELFTTFDLASSIDRGREEAKRCILVPFENSLIIDFLTRILGPAAAGAIRSSGRKK
jgi:hypothetical protein